MVQQRGHALRSSGRCGYSPLASAEMQSIIGHYDLGFRLGNLDNPTINAKGAPMGRDASLQKQPLKNC